MFKFIPEDEQDVRLHEQFKQLPSRDMVGLPEHIKTQIMQEVEKQAALNRNSQVTMAQKITQYFEQFQRPWLQYAVPAFAVAIFGVVIIFKQIPESGHPALVPHQVATHTEKSAQPSLSKAEVLPDTTPALQANAAPTDLDILLQKPTRAASVESSGKTTHTPIRNYRAAVVQDDAQFKHNQQQVDRLFEQVRGLRDEGQMRQASQQVEEIREHYQEHAIPYDLQDLLPTQQTPPVSNPE